MNEDQSKRKTKPWKQPKDFPPFSGKSYGELNDIYPFNDRIKDDAWRMVGLFYPAWVITRKQFKEQIGKMRFTRFLELCYMQRCEEAKEGVAFHPYPAMKGMNVSGALFAARKAELTRLGLVENIVFTANRARVYRVTGLGRMIIKCFTENLNQANDNLAMWHEKMTESGENEKLTYYLVTQFPEWKGKGFQPTEPEKPKRPYVKHNHPRWNKEIN